MPSTHTSIASLLEALAAVRPKPALIAIDGSGRAGKSTLCGQLTASVQGAKGIDLDNYLEGHTGQFIASLDLAGVKAAIDECEGVVTFVAGVCVLDALDLIGRPADFHIYIKRMSNKGWGWVDDFKARPWNVDDLPDDELDSEVRAYHVRRRPHEVADAILERVKEV